MGYTTKVLALWRMGFSRAAVFTCSGLTVGIRCSFSQRTDTKDGSSTITVLMIFSSFPIWRFIAMRRFLFAVPGGVVGFGLLSLIGEFRAEGKARRLARRMLDVVGSSCCWWSCVAVGPPRE